MSKVGYRSIRERVDRVATLLRDLAVLVGVPSDESVRLETGGEIAPGLGFFDEAKALRQRASEIEGGIFKIIVLGEFKTGKSTLLNGMLGGKKLPAKATPATAIITVLIHGTGDEVVVFEEGQNVPRRLPWEEFVQEFQLSHDDIETLDSGETIDRFRRVEYAQVEVDHAICASGVRLIDSPGLGEHISRTRVALNFLQQSHAVIFVLNATRLFGLDEREFIEGTLGAGPLPNVFFAVNRINQVRDSDLAEVREWVQRELAQHYVGPDGLFDAELFERRVHFVDARGALEAAIAGDKERREASGVPRLERELERFLATGERVAASLSSTASVMDPLVTAAQARVEAETAALDRPLHELEARHAEALSRLQALQGRRVDIERTIRMFGETVRQKVYGDLSAFVDRMYADWDNDSRQLIDLDRALSLKNVLSAYAQQEAREAMAAELGEEVSRYLQIKFGQWAEQIPAAIRNDVETMMDEVEAQVEELQLELSRIASMFAGTDLARSSVAAGGGALQSMLLTIGEIGSLTDEIMDMGDMSEVIGRLAQQAIAVLLVGTFLTGGNFLIALVLVEVVHLGLHESEVKRRIREGLGKKIHENLHEQVLARRPFIYDTISGQFEQFAESVTSAIGAQLESVRAEHERILIRKGAEGAAVEREKERLRAVGEKVAELAQELRETVERGVPEPLEA